MPETWLWPLVLGGTFAWAAAAKLSRRTVWREALRAHALPAPIERLAERAVPLMEGSVAVLLLAGQVRIGAAFATFLLVAFSVEVIRARRSDDGLVPCGCFGRETRRRPRWLLARNAVLMLTAAVAFAFGEPVPIPSWPHLADALPALLTGFGVALVTWVLSRAATLVGADRVRP
jgi:hypothetical protein